MRHLLSLTIFLIGFSTCLFAQKTNKIEKKLEKKFQQGKIEKVEKKALKLIRKNPGFELSNYYLSRVELIKYGRFVKIPDKKQWFYLRKATGYANKLGPDYNFWKDSIKSIYIKYINSWNDDEYQSAHLKKVVKTYSSYTKDTLTFYYKYFDIKATDNDITYYEIPKTNTLRSAIIEFASDLVGIPYKYAGEKPETGFDCSGFVKYVYGSIGVELPHSAQMQSQLKGEIIPLEQAQPGDLIFFGSRNKTGWNTQHAGIIFEYNPDEPKVIHCVSRGVSIDGNNSSWDHYWKERILFVKRLPALEN